MANQDEYLDWDSDITEDGEEIELLQPGTVDFEVLDFERTRSRKGAPMAKVRFKVRNEKDQQTTIIENFVLTKKAVWKLSELFRSVGLKKHGETVNLRLFDQLPGKTGRCEIEINTYESEKDHKTYENNRVRKFFDHPSIEEAPAEQPVQQGMLW